jgi:mRNA interferase RelE/StbE
VAELKFSKRALRELDNLPSEDVKAILIKLRVFDARKIPKADIKKLKGSNPPEFRFRVGNFRIIYALEKDTVVVSHVLHRKEAYRR